MVSGPFKSGKYHKEYFEKNPFLTEKDGPVLKEKEKRSKSEADLKPFKPSSPPKKVNFAVFFFFIIIFNFVLS